MTSAARLRNLTAMPGMLLLAATLLPASGWAADALVGGDANPNLAGRGIGYSCCSGDSVPGQSPPQVTGHVFGGCDYLEFNVTGRVSYLPGSPTGDNPDGDEVYSMVNYGDGLSAPKNVRVNALVGVFLDDKSPTGKVTPEQLDFFTLGRNFYYLYPKLRQIFFIGDGRTTDVFPTLSQSSAIVRIPPAIQQFYVPPGATRLFFGTVDGEGWFNNSGSFVVETVVYPNEEAAKCGDAVGPDGIFASDSLAVLRAAVGSAPCADCRCDVDHSGAIVANDALAVLRHAVGQGIAMQCPCCFSP